MILKIEGYPIECEHMELKQWTDRKRIYVGTYLNYDIFKIGDKYFYADINENT